jgi:diguanylate cyclase (GGDEF)-like protein
MTDYLKMGTRLVRELSNATPEAYDSEQNRAEDQLAATREVLRVSNVRYHIALETSLDAVAVCRLDNGMFVDVNRAFFEVLGYSREELIGQSSIETYAWVGPDGSRQSGELVNVSGRAVGEISIWCDPGDWERLGTLLREDSSIRNFECMLRKKNGATIWAVISASLIELDGVLCVHFALRDQSAMKAAEDRIKNLSYYDSLTGLPNRRQLIEVLTKLLSEQRQARRHHVLLMIDLDKFKRVIEAYGLAAADRILQEVAGRLSRTVRRNADTASRFGADQFMLLLEDFGATVEEAFANAQDTAYRIRSILAQPYDLDGQLTTCSCKIGVTIFGSENASVDDILQQCAIALAEAKLSGRNSVETFAPEFRVAIVQRASMERDLRCALEQGQLSLHYQPQYAHCQLVGAEALLRWNHPTRGMLLPGKFITMAETSGLIVPIGNWVLENVCGQVSEWKRTGRITENFRVAINISAHQFRQRQFQSTVLKVIEKNQTDPKNIELELTESALIEDTETTAGRMRELKTHGVRLALDDFGTGYSCLSYLSRLPLDKLKIDISFVREILTNPTCGAIARAIINLSEALGLAVTAEGVETAGQRDYLARLGCHAYQGYLFGRPMPADQFDAQLVCEGADRSPVPELGYGTPLLVLPGAEKPAPAMRDYFVRCSES